MLLSEFRNGISDKTTTVKQYHVFVYNLVLMAKRNVKFSQEEFQTSSVQIILHISPDRYPPELTSGELLWREWFQHIHLFIFSLDRCYRLLFPLFAFSSIQILQSSHKVETPTCWPANWGNSWYTQNMYSTLRYNPNFHFNVKDYYFLLLSKN